MDFAEWSLSIQTQIIYLTICISIPSMALYIAEIVTIVRHKKFHNSFYALFVMRAIPDWLGVLNSFCCNRFPAIIGAVLYPIYSKFPNWMLAMFYFFAAQAFQANIFATAFILLNRLTAIIMPIKHEKDPNSTTDRNFDIYEAGDKVSISGNNNIDDIEKKLLIYALATFLGHALVASQLVITDIWLVDDTKTRFMLGSYFPLILDSGTVVLSSWLLLWASGTFRQHLIKDFAIIRKTNIQNIRVDAQHGPRNNNHRAVGGAVGHQYISSVQQLPTIST
ncbi:hypothetical protein GPALN_009780 [Globodera pallida]|nr:hypothetical protein GPALN_009780 [Globodera pallida]